MNQKKIPLRSCVITKEKLSKKELIRVVRDNTGKVMVDLSGKTNGRGAYLKRDLGVIKKARLNKQLDKHLLTNVPDTIYDELEGIINNTIEE